ncbi:hypothetical protein [Sulfitobacter pacificus]|uniref:Uncharacterized protein n=1 Tax=Sulfitobacter pacificus TaxID=1499314 RepID=A0ABQ5VFL2_9RHOB|nr:hypothetical protein [Sulfitobacter pacificus]GLQ25447.1 hypothetical protein GCM10007927_02500 [Sulfitobacter pacificus]
MSDHPKSPKGPFNFRANPDKSLEREDEEIAPSKTDKDNTGFRFDPPNKNEKPALNLSPMGTMGNRGSRASTPPISEKMIIEFTPEGYKEEPDIDLTNDGSLIEGEFEDGTKFLVKSEYPSGVEAGESRMTRMTLIEDGKGSVHFENGWENQIETDRQQEAVDELEEKFGKLHSEKFISFRDKNPEQDKDIDR